MVKPLAKFVGLLLLVLCGAGGLWLYHEHSSAARLIQRLEEEKRELQGIVERLGAERRVAELLVTDQRRGPDGVLVTDVLLVETDREGKNLPARRFSLRGENIHVDAIVIKFDDHFVRAGDGLRGHSIALFQRIYGDRQTPAEAETIDPPGQVPLVYRDADPRVSAFEMELWREFWRLADDEAFRQSRGVRVAQGEGVWGPLRSERLYTLTLEADGGLNLNSTPLPAIYREALRLDG